MKVYKKEEERRFVEEEERAEEEKKHLKGPVEESEATRRIGP